jgi:hypothetical protein
MPVKMNETVKKEMDMAERVQNISMCNKPPSFVAQVAY